MISLARNRNFCLRYGRRPGLPDGREATEAGARGDAGLPEQRADSAAGVALDGQPVRVRGADDAVQHLMTWTLYVGENQE